MLNSQTEQFNKELVVLPAHLANGVEFDSVIVFSDGDSKVMTVMSKGQNAVACSRVFDYVHFTEGKKQVIIMLDDNDDAKNSSENLNWVYDADFELLNDDNIERIIVGGKRCFDYKVRLMLAGVPEDKIITSIDENSTIDYIVKDNSKVFILHDIWEE